MGVQMMTATLKKAMRSLLIAAILIGGASMFAPEATAQRGYYRTYRPYSYRSLSRTGKYHGYWRDLGYGYNDRGARGQYIPPVNYYYGGYAPVYPAPNYYIPPPSPYGYR